MRYQPGDKCWRGSGLVAELVFVDEGEEQHERWDNDDSGDSRGHQQSGECGGVAGSVGDRDVVDEYPWELGEAPANYDRRNGDNRTETGSSRVPLSEHDHGE